MSGDEDTEVNFEQQILFDCCKLVGFQGYLCIAWIFRKLDQDFNKTALESLVEGEYKMFTDKSDFKEGKFLYDIINIAKTVGNRIKDEPQRYKSVISGCILPIVFNWLLDRETDVENKEAEIKNIAEIIINDNYLQKYVVVMMQSGKKSLFKYDELLIRNIIKFSEVLQPEDSWINFESLDFINQEQGEDLDGDLEMGVDEQGNEAIFSAYNTFFETAKTEFTSRIRDVVQSRSIRCLTIDEIKNFMQDEQLRQVLPNDRNFYYNMLWNALKEYRETDSSQNLKDITVEQIVQDGRPGYEFLELSDLVRERFPFYFRISS